MNKNINVKKEIVKRTMELRSKCSNINPNQARFIESDCYKFEDEIYSRLRVILRSNGCSIPTCTMCPFPNEAADPKVQPISAEQYVNQVTAALPKNDTHDILSIYNDGSFFAETE